LPSGRRPVDEIDTEAVLAVLKPLWQKNLKLLLAFVGA
jgi:hypothetical protein